MDVFSDYKNSDPVLDAMRASRDSRTFKRRDDEHRAIQVSAGYIFPSSDDLLRGFPFFGASFSLDLKQFIVLLRQKSLLKSNEGHSLEGFSTMNPVGETSYIEQVRAIERALAELAGDEISSFREERLRCRLYLSALGDTDAALELAMDAMTDAFRQEWHLVGDGSIPVWIALGWLAQAASSRSRDNLASGSAITPKWPPAVQVLSIADDLRTRVERCVLELNSLGE